jgi:Arc/MetJ-type ribon-helix-helix transcriptional regulator
VGGERRLFTTLSIPVMTRLRLPERQVLDTLVEAGVARSRSEALAWCVRLVGEHQADWIRELREALVKVGELRRRGPA